MAARQREISVSEFFTKNRHLLGFDNPQKALLTAVKEAVDNSLDACEEAGILPDLEIENRGERREAAFASRCRTTVRVSCEQQIPKIFGKLLYGSKFHRLKQQRGQQGIGISAAGMYGQLTTGRPVRSSPAPGKRQPAHLFLHRHRHEEERTADPEGQGELIGIRLTARGSRSSWRRSTRRGAARWTITWSRPRWSIRTLEIRYLSPKDEPTILRTGDQGTAPRKPRRSSRTPTA